VIWQRDTWQLDEATQHHVLSFLVGYIAVAVVLYAWGYMLRLQGVAPIADEPAAAGEHSHAP